ncbi:MAG: type II toxin-antitoxin system PemK/MazF family toxin [Bacteroidales bacterium]|nr:type II toxin-antitoxin system PemK/MazF family toxin [Bacteroidales bacterium]
MELNQYSIILVDLNPTIGSEMKKSRPCIVVSPNEMNRHLRTIVIAPMTTSLKKYPTRVKIQHNEKVGRIAIDQLRTIDKQRIVKVLGSMSKSEIKSVKSVIKETFVD